MPSHVQAPRFTWHCTPVTPVAAAVHVGTVLSTVGSPQDVPLV
jgi:hypothetical protein